MKKWEYKVLVTNMADAPQIQEYGMEGWELISVTQMLIQTSQLAPPTPLPVFYFKRELDESKIADKELAALTDAAETASSGKLQIVGH